MKAFGIIFLFWSITVGANGLGSPVNGDKITIKNVLIVIGYSDGQESWKSVLTENNFFPGLAKNAATVIRDTLAVLDFTEKSPDFFVNSQKAITFTLLNANSTCRDHSDLAVTSICPDQDALSKNLVQWLDLHLKDFDSLMFLGHSRTGMGLGVGPLRPESPYTYKLHFFNEIEKGKLKQMILASCDSNHYYKKNALRSGFEFTGIDKGYLWQQELLPFLINQISDLVERAGLLNALLVNQ